MTLAAAIKLLDRRRQALHDPALAAELAASDELRRRPRSPAVTVKDLMASIERRALAWVQEASPEWWGERWLTVARALPRYDGAKASLPTFLERCWLNRRYDLQRRSIAAKRDRRRTRSYVEGRTRPRRRAPEPALCLRISTGAPPPQVEIMGLVARGCSIVDAGTSLGVAAITARRRFERARNYALVA